MKDSAGYGSITITKAVSIVGDGSLAGILASSGQNVITINADASDVVEVRAKDRGAAAGNGGVAFNSGGKLDLANCTVQNFTNSGIDLLPSSRSSATFVLANTTVAHNSVDGIYYSPGVSISAKLFIDRIIATDNYNGVDPGRFGAVMRGNVLYKTLLLIFPPGPEELQNGALVCI